MTSSRFFLRLQTKRDAQINFTRYNSGWGMKTWPPTYNGHRKRSINFGLGYWSWRIK